MLRRLLAPAARAVVVLGSYAAVAVAFNWPLPLVLHDKLTGSIAGDTGVYVWNLWVFHHEATAHHRFPLFTSEVLTLSPPVDLSLHNYTLFADLLAFPLIPWVGVTASFNLVYLALVTATAGAMYLLARSVVGRAPEAWLAGLLFGFCPVLMARATAHFSLAAAAPLPLFVLALRRAERDRDGRFAALAGAAAAWAAMWDAYYGIFCLLIAAGYLGGRYVVLPRVELTPRAHRVRRRIDVSLAAVSAALLAIGATGAEVLALGGQQIRLRPLHTPVLLLTLLVIARLCVGRRLACAPGIPGWREAGRLVAAAGVSGVVVLAPILYAFGHSLADGADLHGPIYWRSSPPGVDLLSFLVPNPSHSWWGHAWDSWLSGLPNGYVENIASVPLVAVLLARFRPPRVWVVLTAFLGLLALGPFVRVAGIDTHVPGPWALLRYVPIITATRTPARYTIPLMMGLSVLFALSLAHLARGPRRVRVPILIAVGLALAFELSPFPRPLYDAQVPAVNRIIAADPRDVTVLNLPFGIRSGEWSQGNFTAASLFYQTVHEKRLIGGYLSRIGRQELGRQRQSVMVSRLMQLSEGGSPSGDEIDEVRRRGKGFVERARLGYVIINTATTPPALRQVAIDAFGLVKQAESDGYELYVPTVGDIASN